MNATVFIQRILHKITISTLELCLSLFYFISYLILPLTKRVVTKILDDSDVKVDGTNAGDPKVKNGLFYCLFAKYSYTGLIDAYENSYFDCDDLYALFYKIETGKHTELLCYHPTLYFRSLIEKYLFSLQVFEDTEAADIEYESVALRAGIGEEEPKTQSMAYWKHAKTLDEAFTAKFELIAKKLKLKKGMKVLDVGCGEGTLCKYLAEKCEVEVTGINVSKEMTERAMRHCNGLNVKFRLIDGRRVTGLYDRITVIGLVEHFGRNDYREFFEAMHRCLTDDGLLILELLSTNNSLVPTSDGVWQRSIHLHVTTPYYLDVLRVINGLFVVEDLQNLSIHSQKTTKAWIDDINRDWNHIVSECGIKAAKATKAGYEYFYAHSAARHLDNIHVVFSKRGLKDGYDSVNYS